MTITNDVTHEDLNAIVDQVWESFVGDEMALVASEPTDPGAWTAVVTIDGDWTGSVALAMTARAAHIVAGGMLGMSVDEAAEMDNEDIADAVGELINVIGGNVKSLIGGHSQLSLPVVTTGQLVSPGDAVEVGRVDRVVEAEALTLEVHAFTGGAGGRA